MGTEGRDERRGSREEYFHKHCDAWLIEAIRNKDLIRVAAAQSNLRRALRSDEGRDAALIAIGEVPHLTRRFLPRVWSVRQAELFKIRARRSSSSVTNPPKE